ncbi:MAG: hypothetical protein ACOYD0_12150 [Candidatus Nanopelagicales bacterium]
MTDQPDAHESSSTSDELTEAHQPSEEITDRRVDLHKDEMGHSALHQLRDKVEVEADQEDSTDGTTGSDR